MFSTKIWHPDNSGFAEVRSAYDQQKLWSDLLINHRLASVPIVRDLVERGASCGFLAREFVSLLNPQANRSYQCVYYLCKGPWLQVLHLNWHADKDGVVIPEKYRIANVSWVGHDFVNMSVCREKSIIQMNQQEFLASTKAINMIPK